MNVISLYSGAGGIDLGLEAAGFQTRVAVEFEPDAVATLRANRDWTVLDQDIHLIPSQDLLTSGHLGEGEVDLLAGGPPCQPFSKSGYWAKGDARRLDDPRASTLDQYLRVLRDLMPQVFLLENVPGIGFKDKDEGLALLRSTVEAINRRTGTRYEPQVFSINTADYGIPQERQRVFVIGDRDGRLFHFPEPTHRSFGAFDGTELPLDLLREPALTAWDAIGDLENDESPELRVRGKWAELLPSIPEGQNYLYHTDRGEGLPLFGWRRRYWSFLLKLAKRRPSWTITAQPGSAIGPFHWKNRRLSSTELMRLQTFPDGYRIIGSQSSIRKQLGNAVPCAMAEILGRAIRNQFLGNPFPQNAGIRLIPLRRVAVPPEEPVVPVPERYLNLVATHAPHPGTGKGYGAAARAKTAV
ncbi:MAG TPA: DNA cytosine methyltransferase [Longimicrobium sp.]|jgi:DNA (cytosine-5)-methyltransferase 1|uniref:DNA cytosine methyltransferase n=1 Tax=Longimicrobium sp. TaxID=2029185 RepID=UPI002EDB5B37